MSSTSATTRISVRMGVTMVTILVVAVPIVTDSEIKGMLG